MDATPPDLAAPDAETPELPEVEQLSLAADFDPVDRQQWVAAVAKVLRRSGYDGDDPVGELVTRTLDGIDVQPLYTRQQTVDSGRPGVAPFVRGSRAQGSGPAGWDVRAHHARPDADAVLADLENGVTSLWLGVGRGRIEVADLPQVLDGVFLDLAPVALDAGAEAAAAAQVFVDLAGGRGVDPHALSGSLGFDPVGHRARSGAEQDLADAVAWALRCADETPRLRAITVDALPYHEAGGSDAQELGCALAAGVAYLRALQAAAMPLAEAVTQLEFRYAASADQFATIAKLRAARLLWARVGEVAGIPAGARGQRLHAVSSWAMTTRRDPWGNLLRDTLACFGAGVGGADAVTVLPFDVAIGQPDAFSRRIARNTQTMLMEESHLFRVIDPAGGSWYVEQLTRELAQQAWAVFQRIESAGGIEAALNEGMVAETLAATAAERRERLAHRRQQITGVTSFPLLDEREIAREPWPEQPHGGLPRVRYASDYEALRDRSDAALAATGSRPTVLLVPIGSGSKASARATAAAGALQPGGIVTPLASGDDPGQALRGSGARAVCLCPANDTADSPAHDPAAGPNDDTAGAVSRAAAALREAGAVTVLAAGPPGDYEGIDHHLGPDTDLVATLAAVLDSLEVPA
jgi:methylmalonyl-CoA mutase